MPVLRCWKCFTLFTFIQYYLFDESFDLKLINEVINIWFWWQFDYPSSAVCKSRFYVFIGPLVLLVQLVPRATFWLIPLAGKRLSAVYLWEIRRWLYLRDLFGLALTSLFHPLLSPLFPSSPLPLFSNSILFMRARASLRHNIIHRMSATCQDDLIKSRDYDSTSAAAYRCISLFIYLFSLNPPSCAVARPLMAHLITTTGGRYAAGAS